MDIYLFLFFLFLFPALHQTLYRKSTIVFGVAIVISAIIVGIRYWIGTDWGEYYRYYKSIPVLYHLKSYANYRYERLYTFSNSLFKTIGFDYQFFFFIFSLITSLVLVWAISKFNKKYLYLSFLIYFSYHFLQYEMNIIRHGMAASIIMLAFYYSAKKNIFKYILCVSVASLIQSIALAFLPFYWINRQNIGYKFLIILLGISLAIYLFFDFFSLSASIPLFQSQMDYYLGDFYANKEETSYGISLGLLFYFTIGLISRFKYLKMEYESNMKVRVVVNMLFYSFILGLALNQVGIFVERLVGVLNMGSIIVLPLLLDHFRGKFRLLFLLGILTFCALSFNVSIHMKGGYKAYQYIPYDYKI